tara:strand:+ start:1066 stop:1242 length:177 start_codon:yes stop_codon:yes gene_type:complete
MKYLKPYVISHGKKNIPISDVLEIRKNKDGVTEIWTKPILSTTSVRELQDELARKKQW